MNKYFYLFGFIISVATFFLGWSHYQDHGLNAFSLGFIALTPIISFTLTTIWLRADNKKKEAKDFFVDK